MTTPTFADAYLSHHITPERIDRATAEVAALGTLPEPWPARLLLLRAYIITALECQAQPDDLFAHKLKHYRQEWDAALVQARAAASAGSSGGGGSAVLFAIGLERA